MSKPIMNKVKRANWEKTSARKFNILSIKSASVKFYENTEG